jgi:hypothetical protein
MDATAFRDRSSDQLADIISRAVSDPRLGSRTLHTAAAALLDGRASRPEMARVLSFIAAGRAAGTIHSPAAYFAVCLSDMLRMGIASEPQQQRRA